MSLNCKSQLHLPISVQKQKLELRKSVFDPATFKSALLSGFEVDGNCQFFHMLRNSAVALSHIVLLKMFVHVEQKLV